MLQNHTQLRENLTKCNDVEIEALLLSSAAKGKVGVLISHSAELDASEIKPQRLRILLEVTEFTLTPS